MNGDSPEREEEAQRKPCISPSSSSSSPATFIMGLTSTAIFYLSEHPSIVGFRWSPAQSYGSTWLFLISSISTFILLSLLLHLLLRRPLPLGPLPAVHSLLMSLLSATMFSGLLLSSAAEIRDTRWFWHPSKTPLQWLLCFPLGTRPSGRVFFWSYLFYLSRFFHMFRTFFSILLHRKLPFFQLFNHSISTLISFLWLEFSQSFQVLAILFTSLVYSLLYGYRFWTAVGFRGACFPFVLNCQIVLLSCNLISHVGVFLVHFFYRGGCNGIGAWILNSVLNSAILLMSLNYFYVRVYVGRKAKIDGAVVGGIESKPESTSVLSVSAGEGVDLPKLKVH